MVGLKNLMLERKEIDKILRETEEKFKSCEISNLSFEEFVRRSRHTYMTTLELAEKCKEKKIIALTSRDDEENTRFAVELCKCISQNNTGNILYFSLKASTEKFRSNHPELKVAVDDTAAISIETLECKLKCRNQSSKVSMIVIDCLPLMTSCDHEDFKWTDNEQLLTELKQISEQERISIIVLLPLSKYAPSNYSIQKELEIYYGDYISCVDFTVFVSSEWYDCQNEANFVYIGGCDNNG